MSFNEYENTEAVLKDFKKNPEWAEYQKSSENKWRSIREKVKQSKSFHMRSGWFGLEVVDRCGYCDFFSNIEGCKYCPLLIIDNFCNPNRIYRRTVFWDFVDEMNKNYTDFRKALGLVTKMLMRIREDRPLV